MMTKQQIADGRRIMLQRYMDLDPKGTAIISLSGGVDSTTVLFAALECGFKPQCITFHVKQFWNDDLAAAQKLTKTFGLNLDVVEIDDSLDALIRDCYWLIDNGIQWRNVKTVKPTLFQIPHPYLHVLPKVTGSHLITGNSGDILAVSHREAAIAYRKGLDPYGVAVRAMPPLEGRTSYHVWSMARHFSVKLTDFFDSVPIFHWARAIPVDEYNQPRPKWGHAAPFASYWKRGGFYRRAAPYQIVSGIQRLHEKLCKTEHNPKGRRVSTPITAYRNMVASRGIQVPGEYWTKVARMTNLEPLHVEAIIRPATLVTS